MAPSMGPVLQVPPLEAQGREVPLSHLHRGDRGFPRANNCPFAHKSLLPQYGSITGDTGWSAGSEERGGQIPDAQERGKHIEREIG